MLKLLMLQGETPLEMYREMEADFVILVLHILRLKNKTNGVYSLSMAAQILLICQDLTDWPQSAPMKMQ